MRKITVVLLLLLLSTLAPVQAQKAKPQLVVVLVVDQMRADYLTRYGGLFQHGLKTLTSEGAWFTNASYPYFNTVTCAGHSTIGTGDLPFHHGMIANAWYNRETGKTITCNEDDHATEIPYGTIAGLPAGSLTKASDSASWMLAPTLAETMRDSAKSRVATMSIKARSAIGLAGHKGDFVTWLDERGAWATSSAFTSVPVPWFTTFLKANPLDRDADKAWERTLPPDRYQYEDDAPGERGSAGWGATFPHKLGPAGGPYIQHWVQSPFADEYLEQMAEAAVDDMRLGHDADRTDFLGVSFSTLDVVGHAYGPRSHEVQDVLVRLDATIGRLLEFLDKKVGAGKYVVALSADHGVADVPEQVPNAGRVNAATVRATIEAAAKTALGGEGPFIAAASGGDIYFKPDVYGRLKKDPAALRQVIDAALKIPGVARVIQSDEIAPSAARASKDPIIRAAALSYFPGRSGDLLIVQKESWILSAAGTTHGTPYPYDRQVPVILYGARIKRGIRKEPAMPADIAPTLASLLDVRLPAPDGHVLKAALTK
jgi:predicted AlkP superfamily pyrophosphatase or phosphodiesterase